MELTEATVSRFLGVLKAVLMQLSIGSLICKNSTEELLVEMLRYVSLCLLLGFYTGIRTSVNPNLLSISLTSRHQECFHVVIRPV